MGHLSICLQLGVRKADQAAIFERWKSDRSDKQPVNLGTGQLGSFVLEFVQIDGVGKVAR